MAKVRGVKNSSSQPLKYHYSVKALAKSIKAAPEDEAGWLILCDWLEENGYEYYADRVKSRIGYGVRYRACLDTIRAAISEQLYLSYRLRNSIHLIGPVVSHTLSETLKKMGVHDVEIVFDPRRENGISTNLGWPGAIVCKMPDPTHGDGRLGIDLLRSLLKAMGIISSRDGPVIIKNSRHVQRV